MKNRITLVLAALVGLTGMPPLPLQAQIPMSAGAYTQNFDSLATAGTVNLWVNNTKLPGWYSTRNGTNVSNYRAGDGGSNAGDLWSYGVVGVSNINDRALGAVASGSATSIHFGVRLVNDTGATFTNFSIAYTGEQWRNGGNTTPHTLAFAYQVSALPLTNPALASGWITVAALDYITPTVGSTTGALDGNATTNRQIFNVALAGVSVPPGYEMFLRWRDVDDLGGDHGFGIDDLIINFAPENAGLAAPTILIDPVSQTVTAGDPVQFTTLAGGNPAPAYQWLFNGTNISDATNTTLTLNSITTNAAGSYHVIATNSQGSATSQVAILTVNLPATGVSILTYNVKGNGAADWSTNAAQIQAIARQLQYLQPDVITFNEIPNDLRHEMTNFVAAFLPGYQLAISPGNDFFICSAIASRFPITRATSWLDAADLKPFGYTNTATGLADNFTRDLFEAEIAVPGFARPLHVFTTHLKATTSGEFAESAAKRAAEAAAITNFFATNLFALYPYDPYVLTGDMNANDTNELAIQKLVSPATGLTLTNPRNPVTGSINTFSTTTANPGSRLDYIFSGPLLYSNIKTSQVFRTDRLVPLPPNLNSNDCKVASDHLPVLMEFNNPYDQPFKLLSITRTNPTVTLQWQSVFGQSYRVEASPNLTTWSLLESNLVATGTNFTYSTNLHEPTHFFRVSRAP